ncbi:cation diffusion facilitator family transporter [Sneathiella limimaris]|uniref:cation diffusion facilitator family transporter n=1 Tax=Sneathiella limimaris TaxID=1964213 RepID=UPI00146C7EC7|nr:cation diffusion facilitator family transporter [Sneathiella limimaris]
MAEENAQSEKLMRRATYFAVSAASFLILIKVWAYFLTGSVSILSTMVDSILDLGASAINLLAVRHALEPADKEHRFGHGKAESLAGLFQSAFIIGSAIFLAFHAIDRIFNPQPIGSSTAGIVVMVISILVTVALVAYQKSVVRRTQSVAISADSLHYFGDVLVNFSVIVSLVLATYFDLLILDGVFAMGIALYICFNAWSIIRESFKDLMDHELSDEDRSLITQAATRHPEVWGIHELRTRRSGQQIFIQLHLDLDPNQSLADAHRISEEVDEAILALFPTAETLIHQDPAPTSVQPK